MKVATTYNISPIKGRTIILLDTNESTGLECKTARIGKSNMVTIKQLQNHQGSSKYETTMETVLRDLISQQVLVDNLIILSQGLTDNTDLVLSLNQFLSKYRVCVNRKLLFVNVVLSSNELKNS